jgi:hypothetical protein
MCADRSRPERFVDAIDEIRHLYYNATRTTIERDLRRAVALLTSIPDEDLRQRAAVYMDGLAEMRKEWAGAKQRGPGGPRRR